MSSIDDQPRIGGAKRRAVSVSKPCRNDPKGRYRGDEPSPKGYGWCARAEKLGTVRKGRDRNDWKVIKTSATATSRRWSRVSKAGLSKRPRAASSSRVSSCASPRGRSLSCGSRASSSSSQTRGKGKGKGLKLVAFTMRYCPPCKRMLVAWRAMQRQYPEMRKKHEAGLRVQPTRARHQDADHFVPDHLRHTGNLDESGAHVSAERRLECAAAQAVRGTSTSIEERTTPALARVSMQLRRSATQRHLRRHAFQCSWCPLAPTDRTMTFGAFLFRAPCTMHHPPSTIHHAPCRCCCGAQRHSISHAMMVAEFAGVARAQTTPQSSSIDSTAPRPRARVARIVLGTPSLASVRPVVLQPRHSCVAALGCWVEPRVAPGPEKIPEHRLARVAACTLLCACLF